MSVARGAVGPIRWYSYHLAPILSLVPSPTSSPTASPESPFCGGGSGTEVDPPASEGGGDIYACV